MLLSRKCLIASLIIAILSVNVSYFVSAEDDFENSDGNFSSSEVSDESVSESRSWFGKLLEFGNEAGDDAIIQAITDTVSQAAKTAYNAVVGAVTEKAKEHSPNIIGAFVGGGQQASEGQQPVTQQQQTQFTMQQMTPQQFQQLQQQMQRSRHNPSVAKGRGRSGLVLDDSNSSSKYNDGTEKRSSNDSGRDNSKRHYSSKTLVGSPYETKDQANFITSTSLKSQKAETLMVNH